MDNPLPMQPAHFRILKALSQRREGKRSVLFDNLALIKDAWEFGFGVPPIVEALRQTGVTDGISIANVQGFVKRCQRDDLIGAKGCRKAEYKRLIAETVGDEHNESPVSPTAEKEIKSSKFHKKSVPAAQKPTDSGQPEVSGPDGSTGKKSDQSTDKKAEGLAHPKPSAQSARLRARLDAARRKT